MAADPSNQRLYNGMDCCATLELSEKIPMSNSVAHIYSFERALQAPVLEMMLRGIRVDTSRLETARARLMPELIRLRKDWREITDALGCPTLDSSWQQLSELLYDFLGYPPVFKKGRPSTDREALLKLKDDWVELAPLIGLLLGIRDHAKQLQFLSTGIDDDGRFRCSYSIAGTETGRFSSSANAFGTGANIQNITERLRNIFIPDEGMKFANFDLKQAEAYVVALLVYRESGNRAMLDALNSGDVHTSVCRMVWPQLGWTGELKADKALAEEKSNISPIHSWRDVAKRIGHGSNYMLQPFGMARRFKLPQWFCADFQQKYLAAFGVTAWHTYVAKQLQLERNITTLYGRKRYFHGRERDPATLREAVAYEPQSVVAEHLNSGMLRVWYSRRVQLLAQVHDSILVQYPDNLPPAEERALLTSVRDDLERDLRVAFGSVETSQVIPAECMIGYNWGKAKKLKDGTWVNSRGLREYNFAVD